MKLPIFRKSENNHRIAMQFRNTNIALFILATAIIITIAVFVLRGITDTVSKDYARIYSENTSSSLGVHLNKEIALVKKIANSDVIINWFADEFDEDKKAAALGEMLEIIDVLYSDNIYLAIGESLNEYTVDDSSITPSEFQPQSKLVHGEESDVWYFDSVAARDDYVLNVDIDKILQRKRVWINHKVERNGETLGIISSGLEFARTAEEVLGEYSNSKIRGVIIDENGVVQMDSDILKNETFLQFEYSYNVLDEFCDSTFRTVLNEHLAGIDGFFTKVEPIVIKLREGEYSYATITAIEDTKWSVITFYDSSVLFNATMLMPLIMTVILIMICYALISGSISYKLLFKPIDMLIESLAKTAKNRNESIYGYDRADEVGSLSRAVTDLLRLAQNDTLTGIYNRRLLDETIDSLIQSVSRADSMMSVMMIDIDYFKKYNDTYGHGMGDECLVKVAKALSENINRADDFVARYGGEEFVAVLPFTDEEGAQVIADRLLKNISGMMIPHINSDVAPYVTVSIGVVTAKAEHTQVGKDYLDSADKALYMSKNSGRNRYTVIAIDK